jgi:hypothetical protein
MMESFQLTHRKFMDGECRPEVTQSLLSDAWDGKLAHHRIHFKQAWKDGMRAARRLLSGHLPRALRSVLGITQVASAIRSSIDDVESTAASEDKFLSDLGRWRQLLPGDSHAAFDHYADLLRDERPPSDAAWKEVHDAETLVYFQDLLAELLVHVGVSPPVKVAVDSALSSSATASDFPVDTTNAASPPTFVHCEAWQGSDDALDATVQDRPKHTTLAELALYSAGAIFALTLAYILRKLLPNMLPRLVLTL